MYIYIYILYYNTKGNKTNHEDFIKTHVYMMGKQNEENQIQPGQSLIPSNPNLIVRTKRIPCNISHYIIIW